MAQVQGGYINLTGWLHDVRLTRGDASSGLVMRGWHALVALILDVPAEFNIDEMHYFLPIVEHTPKQRTQPEIHGIIVQDTETGKCQFRRIGTFYTISPIAYRQFRRPTYDPLHPPKPKKGSPGAYTSKAGLGSVDIWDRLPGNDNYDKFMPGFDKTWSEETITLI